MHALIHMCRVLHNKALEKKNPYYSDKRHQSFQMTKLQENRP